MAQLAITGPSRKISSKTYGLKSLDEKKATSRGLTAYNDRVETSDDPYEIAKACNAWFDAGSDEDDGESDHDNDDNDDDDDWPDAPADDDDKGIPGILFDTVIHYWDITKDLVQGLWNHVF